jgi:hypothetical protein
LRGAFDGALILFGEWCHARHTVPYDKLPDWFLAFDVFDRASGCFWNTERRNNLARTLDVETVPQVFRGKITLKQVPRLMDRSRVGSVPAEGIYIRREDEQHLLQRAKVVAPAFQQQIEAHWTRRPLVPNRLASATAHA